MLVLSAVVLLVVAGSVWWCARWGPNELAQAEAALRRHDLSAAVDHLARHLDRRPRDAAALLLAGRTARRLDRLADAERYLTRCQEVGGVTDATRLEWALLRVQQGEGGEVEARLKRTIPPDHPNAPLVLEALARGYLRTDRFLGVLQACDLWVTVQPDHPWPWAWRASVYARLGNLNQARADYRRALEALPDDRLTRLALADLYVRGRQPGDAVEHYQWVLERAPKDREALVGVAACRLEQGKPEEAVPLLDRILADIPDHPRALFLRGKAALDLRDAVGAERWLVRAVERATDDEALYQLTLALRAQGKRAEADRLGARLEAMRKDVALLDRLTRAIAQRPDDPGLRHQAGEAALRLGRHDEGVRWLLGALKLREDHAPTHAALADHFRRMGDPRAEHHRRVAEAADR